MTDKLFINKYQPLYFKDFGENNEIINMLNTLIKIDDLNILFIGDMASGKTSILNALIREYYNGFSPKDYEENVLYINSLKEQGINYYRTDVKTFCQTCSNIKGKKKFVVLDDIDFINEQSQQVFRNCIDKFSHNVNFISSCTNNQKVIESLQSRLTIIKIKPLQKENLISIIEKIKIIENIEIDEDAKNFIVNISNNTVNISFLTFEEYTDLLLQSNLLSAIELIYKLNEKGYSVMDILDNYFIFIKTTNILTEDQKYKIIPYLCKYITIFHNIHEDEIELALFTNNLIKILSE
jgi:replication-associated recombination protein RarA